MNLDLGIGLNERLKKEFVQYNRAKYTNAMSILELSVRTSSNKKSLSTTKITQETTRAFGDITVIGNGKNFYRGDPLDISQTEFNLK